MCKIHNLLFSLIPILIFGFGCGFFSQLKEQVANGIEEERIKKQRIEELKNSTEKIAAEALFTEFEANESAANAKFKNKSFIISSHFTDNFPDGKLNYARLWGKDSKSIIHCYYDGSFGNREKYQTADVYGEYKGFKKEAGNSILIFQNCLLIWMKERPSTPKTTRPMKPGKFGN